MKSAPSLGNASLLALLTAAIAACSSSPSTNQTSAASGSTGHPASSVASGSSGHGGAGGVSMTSATGGPAGSGGAGGAPGTGGAASTGGAPGTGGATATGGAATSSSNGASVRRPFLVGSSLRSASAVPGGDWSRELADAPGELDEATARLLAQTWLKDGLEEHASVAAFARFTLHLLSVGAPPDLVESSQRASLDEVRHARACFALAERYSGRALGPSPLVIHDAMGALSLAEIAALTAEEGCVGETVGAAIAREQLAVARDPEVCLILRRVAADEERHAELAWRFVKWATMVGGADVERAVVAAVQRAVSTMSRVELKSYAGIDLDAWHAHGRLTCAESQGAVERAIREVVQPCLATVLGSDRRPGESAAAVS